MNLRISEFAVYGSEFSEWGSGTGCTQIVRVRDSPTNPLNPFD